MTHHPTDFLAVLKELTHVYDPDELKTLPLVPKDYAQMNEQLATLFQVLPPSHIVWHVIKNMKTEREWHREQLQRCDDELANLGLKYNRDGAEYYIYCIDYQRFAEVFHDYTAKHDKPA